MSIDEQWDQSDQSGLVGKVAAGRYLVVADLGADHRRTRYEAEDVEDGTRVALEVLKVKVATSDDAKLRSLKHPNLACVLATGKLDTGESYLATELVRGKSLRAQITGGHLESRRALSIVRQLLQALAAAHAAGAIHGNVKPDNVTVSVGDGGDRATLLDLGVSMLSGADRAGDPRYRAPECATGPVDPRADLYAVGAMLFELLTDHPVFFAGDEAALIRMHAYAPVQTLERRAPDRAFTPELETLVARALAKQPDERFQSADEMIVALDAAMTSVEAASVAALAAKPPQPARDESLSLLAQGLIPAAPRHSDPVIAVNTSRQVRELPWPTRALKLVRRWLHAIDRRLGKHRLIVAAVGGVLVLALVIGLVARGHGTAAAKTDAVVPDPPIVSRARSLVAAGHAQQAIDVIRGELAGHPDDGAAYLVLGHAHIALGQLGEGLGAYGRAIQQVPALANDAELVANVTRVLSSRDAATAKVALELLSSSTSSAAQDALIAQASNNPVADMRHRAFAILQKAGMEDRIDRVSSWALDLRQAKTCDERRAIIVMLAPTQDPRALPALRQARGHKCVLREATAAIHQITEATKKH